MWLLCLLFTVTENLPLMAGVLSALVFLVLLGGAVIYTQEKMKRNKATGTKQHFPFPYSLHSYGFFGLFINLKNSLNNFFNNPLLSLSISLHATLSMMCLCHFHFPLCRGSRWAGINLCRGQDRAAAGIEGAAEGRGGGGVWPSQVFRATSADCRTNRRWLCVRQGP